MSTVITRTQPPSRATVALPTLRFHAECLLLLLTHFLNGEFALFPTTKVLHPLLHTLAEILSLLCRLSERCVQLITTVKTFNLQIALLDDHPEVVASQLEDLIEVFFHDRLQHLVDDIIELLYKYNMQFDFRPKHSLNAGPSLLHLQRVVGGAVMPPTAVSVADLDNYLFVEQVLLAHAFLTPADLTQLARVVDRIQAAGGV